MAVNMASMPSSSEKKIVLVLGVTGMVGHAVAKCISMRDEFFEVYGTHRNTHPVSCVNSSVKQVCNIDATNLHDLEKLVLKLNPHVIINCIGMLPQADEKCRHMFVMINSLLPQKISSLCSQMGSRFIHISTDGVFDGKRGDYTESDNVSPRGFYNLSKAVGETHENNKLAVTLRVAPTGLEILGKRRTLFGWFLSEVKRAIAENSPRTINGFHHYIFNGVTNVCLGKLVLLIILEFPDLHGVVHVGGEPISKYELLKLLITKLNCADILRINQVYQADCAVNRVLKSNKIKFDGLDMSWDSMLTEILPEFELKIAEWKLESKRKGKLDDHLSSACDAANEKALTHTGEKPQFGPC